MNDIHFIFTGGTIDSYYSTSEQICVPFEESVIPFYLEDVIKPYTKITHETVFMLPSDVMSDKERDAVLKAVQNSNVSRIIICHGTDTMVETAEHLSSNIEDGKTIVLTGSMIPLKEFVLSDAGYNLGYAMAQVQILDPGVYLCMHGRTFEPGKVAKNFKQARFEEKTT